MDVSRAVEESIKVWLALGGLGVVAAWIFLPRRWALGLLSALVLVAALNYARWGTARLSGVDSYDLLHYYLAARYFDEVGYYGLYSAALLADDDAGRYNRKIRRYRAQTPEGGYRLEPVEKGIARGRELRERRFTPERWAAFEGDFLHLQRERGFSPRRFRDFIHDRGFNGTPVWLLVAAPLAKAVDAHHIRWLCMLDVLWLVAAFAAVGWAYGRTSVLVGLFFLLVTYSLRVSTPGVVFLRHDWTAALVIAMCLLRKGHPAVAGALTGLAGLLRLFPAAWAFGPVARAGVRAFQGRRGGLRVERSALRFALGFVVALVVLEGGATLRYGADAVRAHAENILEHIRPDQLTSRRVGFAIAYGHDGALLPRFISDERKREIAAQAPERTAIALALILLLGWGVRRVDEDEAFGYGFIPFFLLSTASYYYFTARITLVITHAARLSELRHRVGLGLLFALEVFSNWAETTYPGHRVFLVGGLSWGLTAYTALMIGWLMAEARAPQGASSAAVPAPAR